MVGATGTANPEAACRGLGTTDVVEIIVFNVDSTGILHVIDPPVRVWVKRYFVLFVRPDGLGSIVAVSP